MKLFWLTLLCLGICLPAYAESEGPTEVGGDEEEESLSLMGSIRERRAELGTRFEESSAGSYFNEHFTLAIEYRTWAFFTDAGTNGDTDQWWNEKRVELEYETELSDNVEFFADIWFQIDDDGQIRSGYDHPRDSDGQRNTVSLQELYFEIAFDDADLRIGKQIFNWGKADVFNPTDRLNPRDFTNLLDDEPIGVYAIALNYYWGDFGLEVVFVPVFTPSRFAPLGTRWAVIPSVTSPPILPPLVRPVSPSEVQYGFRLTTTKNGWDFSLSFYDGVNHFPDAVPVAGPAIQPVFLRELMIGGDFATTFDKLGLRGEFAFIQSDGTAGDDYFVYVLGVDYTWTNVFRDHDIFMILEYAGESVIESAVGGIPSTLQRAFASTVATSIEYQISEFFQINFRAIYNLEGPDNGLVEPEIEWDVSDQLTVIVGVDILFGDDPASLFGIFQNNDQFYARARYTF